MKKELFVTKSNDLIEASYKLSLDEQRLVYMTICQVDPRNQIPKDNYFEIAVNDFCEVFGVNPKVGYSQIENAANEIAERWIKMTDGKERSKLRWVFGVKYHEGKGYVSLGISPPIIPYLTNLKKKFTSIKISQIANLKSVYSIRLLEFIMQFKSTGQFIISLDVFMDRLGIKSAYKRFVDLKRRVIEPSIRELSKKSEIHIEWKPLKNGKGRAVTHLEFIINKNHERTADK